MKTPATATEHVIARGALVANEALDALRPLLLRNAGQVTHERKDDGTPVTEIDRAADRLLNGYLTEAFEDHEIISEEQTTIASGRDWTWIIDPIDGTSNFTTGLPYWSVAVALLFEGHPVLGIVDAPVTDQRFVAIRGEGARCNGHAIHVRERADWADPHHRHVPLMITPGLARRVSRKVRLNVRTMGSAALDMCQVAAGVAAASFHPIPKVWDAAAGTVLVIEAGGAVVDTHTVDHFFPLPIGVELDTFTVPTGAGPDSEYVRALAAEFE